MKKKELNASMNSYEKAGSAWDAKDLDTLSPLIDDNTAKKSSMN